jgi:hypothetical protein
VRVVASPLNFLASSPVEPRPVCKDANHPFATYRRVDEHGFFGFGRCIYWKGYRATLGYARQFDATLKGTRHWNSHLVESERGEKFR